MLESWVQRSSTAEAKSVWEGFWGRSEAMRTELLQLLLLLRLLLWMRMVMREMRSEAMLLKGK